MFQTTVAQLTVKPVGFLYSLQQLFFGFLGAQYLTVWAAKQA